MFLFVKDANLKSGLLLLKSARTKQSAGNVNAKN
jgi:hypothetical protein